MFFVPFFRGLARHLHLACLALTATTATVFAQTAADGFDPNVDGNVYAMARQADGKVIIVGEFMNVSPNGGISVKRTSIARLNPDGSLDDTFAPVVTGSDSSVAVPIRAVAIVGNKILIAGDFTKVGDDTATHQGIARLTMDGKVDTTFKASIGPATSGVALTPRVFAMAVEDDGHIVLGGSFGSATWVDVNSKTQTATRTNLARFDKDGVLDTSYAPNPNGMVMTAAYQRTSGKVIIGGGFTQVSLPETTTRLHAARLNPNGTVDSEWDPKPSDGVTAIAIQNDGKVILGGYFTTVQPRGNDSAVTRTHIARLNADDQGTIDTEFYPVVGGTVLGIGIAYDGSVLVGGHFTQVWGRGTNSVAAPYVARFLSDGTLDTSFYPGVNADVVAFAFQDDHNVIMGGYFTRGTPSGSSSTIVRNHVARVLPSGALDAAFQVNTGGRILTSVTVSDGIIVAGTFTNIGGVTRYYIAKMKSDGSVDPSYQPNTNAPIYAMAYDSTTNKVLIGGAFTAIGTTTQSDGTPSPTGTSLRNHLARLNPDGSVDSEFNPNINGSVGSIVIQSDGQILVGGSFTAVQPFGTSDSVTRAYLLRLTSAGQVDTAFNPNPNASISAIAIQPDDKKIIIGGSFTALQPGATGTITYRNYIARLNTDGTVDTSYNPSPYTASIGAIVIQSDGKALVGGSFTHFLPDGATDWVERHNLVRLNKDGTVDTSFYPDPNGMVLALAIQSDNKILVGGSFTLFQPNGGAAWTQARYIGRLNSNGSVDTSFNLDMPESPGQRVDSIALSGSNILVGGTFTLLHAGTTREARNHFAMVSTTGVVQSFDPGASGTPSATVNGLALQPDGKVIAVGKFTDLGGATSTNIARFNPEGVPDVAFNNVLKTQSSSGLNEVRAVAVRATGSVTPTQLDGFAWLQSDGTLRSSFKPLPADISNPGSTDVRLEGSVLAAAFQSNGQMILGGSFSDLTNNSKGNIVRLNTSNGKLDPSFVVELNGSVLAIAVYPSTSSVKDSIIIAGNFTTVNGVTRNHIARLNPDGSLDTTFDPNANGAVNAVVIQPSDSQVIFAGSFTTLTPNSASSSTTRNYIARVKTDGTLDTTTVYDPNFNGAVNALALDSSERLIVGGSFTTAQPNSATSSTLRSRLARLNKDGSVDSAFDPNPNDSVTTVGIQSDGHIMIGGSFTLLQPVINGNQAALAEHHFIARISPVDGNVDGQFTAGTNATVTSLSVGANDTLVIGGYFTSVYETGSTSANAVARNHIARLDALGSLDTTFNPDVAGVVSYVSIVQNQPSVPQSDGSILVGGSFSSLQSTGVILIGGAFTYVGGQTTLPQPNLAQLNGDGSVNASFRPNPDGVVNALVPLPDGSFLVGGAFANIAGQARSGLARFDSTGALNASFVPTGITGSVTVLATQQQADNPAVVKIIVGTAAGLIRVDASTGKLDSTFTAGASFPAPTALAVQSDGKILVAGATGSSGSKLMRLTANGSVDTTFTTISFTGANDVQAIQLQSNGSILVSGAFTNIASSGIDRLARLTSTGAVDASFRPRDAGGNTAPPNGTVSALAIQSDGRVMIGGSFTSVSGLQRYSLARITVTNSDFANETLGASTDGSTISLMTSGTAPDIAGVTFDVSKDGQSWVPADNGVGVGTRVLGQTTWQLQNATNLIAIKGSTVVYLRARAITQSAGKSAGVYEVVHQYNPSASQSATDLVVGPVQSTVSWDSTHYVWTISSSGVLRIVDAYSGATLSSAQSILIGGSGTSTGSSAARVADLSTRGTVTPASPLQGGFAIVGSSPRPVLIRAVGPGLVPFKVTNYLKTPKMVLFNSAGTVLKTISGWDSALASDFARTGAFPLTTGSADCALLVTLNPGTYTVHVIDGDGGSSPGGDALVEIYDAGDLSDTTSRITNLSSRGTVSTSSNLIGGLYISGSASKTVLVRASGPALTKFQVTDAIADPSVSIYDAAGNVILTNDNWQTSSSSLISDSAYAAAISAAGTAVNAFPFDAGSKDAALVITLPPGAYSVMVNGVNGAAGSSLLEVYELP